MASQKAAVPVSKRRPSKKSIIYPVFFPKDPRIDENKSSQKFILDCFHRFSI
jgi:hypothetical protein